MSDFFGKAFPWLAAAMTGGIPALATMAVKHVSEAIGTEIAPEDAAAAVANATPEQLAVMREKELAFQAECQRMGYTHAEEMARLDIERERVYVADTASARGAFAADRGVFWLGVVILLTFGAMVGLAMLGSYRLLSGGIKVADAGVVAAVFGFLGALVGYVAANAQQVVSYFFGSSRGSAEKNASLTESIRALGSVRPAR